MSVSSANLLQHLDSLSPAELKRVLVEHLTKRKLGLTWEADAIERDRTLNADIVLPRPAPDFSCRGCETPPGAPWRHRVIEGNNFDALRLLRATHSGKVRR